MKGRRSVSPRLPWKRGPAAGNVASRAEEILEFLAGCPRRFLSLRAAARALGLSTQPLRDWIKRGELKHSTPRGHFSVDELVRLVMWLKQHAKPFGPDDYLRRIYGGRKGAPAPFDKLWSAHFEWPTGQTGLTPKELSELAGCHPSLILLAIHRGQLRGNRRTPGRWEITRRAWDEAFPMTLAVRRGWPILPHGMLLSTGVVARHLRDCGLTKASPALVRQLGREGFLEIVRPTPSGRKQFVTRHSLLRYRKNLKIAS